MRVKIQQFLFGKSHSWAVVGQNIGSALLDKGHAVDFVSTDGVDSKFIPPKLQPHIVHEPVGEYDLQVSYTAMHNFPHFLKNGSKNRFGIWAWEFAPYVPVHLIKYHTYCDKMLVPSSFSKDMFISNGIPESKLEVLPHGVNLSQINEAEPYHLKTLKSFKYLMVIGQPHARKRIEGAIEAFYRAFTKADDVVLVAKVVYKNKLTSPFEVNVHEILTRLNKKYPNHPEIELITEFVPNIYSLHKACNVIYTLTYAECFYIPALDGLYCNNVVVAPKYGGHLDFCNDQNSILIDGKFVRAPVNAQYLHGNPMNGWFEADMDMASAALISARDNFDKLLANQAFDKTKYTWSAVADSVERLCS